MKCSLRHFAFVSSSAVSLGLSLDDFMCVSLFCFDVPSHSTVGVNTLFLLFALVQPGRALLVAPAQADHGCHLALEELLCLPRPCARLPQRFLPLLTPGEVSRHTGKALHSGDLQGFSKVNCPL